MKVYVSPTTSSRVLITMVRGQKVTAVVHSNGWCRLRNAAGKIGYCKSSNLSKADVNAGKCWIISDTACLVHASSGKSVQVTYGQCFTYVKREGSRTYIKNRSGETGWIDSDLVTRNNPFNLNTTVYTQVSGKLLQRTAFGKSSASKVSKNTRMTLLSVSPEKTWDAVLYKGKVYYVYAQLLSTKKAPSNGAPCVMRFDANIYKKADMSSKIIARVREGDLVRLTGFVKNFGAKIMTRDGISGYISALPFTIK